MGSQDVQEHFRSAPFGWPKDAIDGALFVMLVAGNLRATINGQPAQAQTLPQNQVGVASFYVDVPPLNVQQRLDLKALFQKIGIATQNGKESEAAAQFLQKLLGEVAGLAVAVTDGMADQSQSRVDSIPTAASFSANCLATSIRSATCIARSGRLAASIAWSFRRSPKMGVASSSAYSSLDGRGDRGAERSAAFTAAAFDGKPEFGNFADAGAVASGIGKYAGRLPGVMFAIALIDASIIGASAVSLSTAYAIGDVLSLRHSLHRKPSDAKGFYAVYCGLIVIAAGLVLTPGAPLGLLTNAVQALAGVLLPSATVFLLLLCNDKAVLGPWANGRWLNIFTGGVIAVLVMLSIILTASVMFPEATNETVILAILGGGGILGVLIALGTMLVRGGAGKTEPQPIAHAMARALRTCHWQPKEARTRPVRSGDLFGDLGERRIARPGILEPILRYRDGVRTAAPFPDQTRAGLQAEARRRANPTRCPQGGSKRALIAHGHWRPSSLLIP
jgi:Natural resistance-associated macrophage protein